jgi:DNA-binding LacI/PurR family transcriptional regulator
MTLSCAEVREIRELREKGKTIREIADLTNHSTQTVEKYLNGWTDGRSTRMDKKMEVVINSLNFLRSRISHLSSKSSDELDMASWTICDSLVSNLSPYFKRLEEVSSSHFLSLITASTDLSDQIDHASDKQFWEIFGFNSLELILLLNLNKDEIKREIEKLLKWFQV